MSTHSVIIHVKNRPWFKWRLADLNIPLGVSWLLLSRVFSYALNSTNSQAAGPPTALESQHLEKWDYEKLLSTVQRGETIHDCVVDGTLLSELLTQTGKVTGLLEENAKIPLISRIRITNAIIEGPVDTAGNTVLVPVSFLQCAFQGNVIFAGSKFSRGLEVRGRSIFNGSVDPSNMQVIGDLSIADSEFRSTARHLFSTLGSLEISIGRESISAHLLMLVR
jgi:hypothetical protein